MCGMEVTPLRRQEDPIPDPDGPAAGGQSAGLSLATPFDRSCAVAEERPRRALQVAEIEPEKVRSFAQFVTGQSGDTSFTDEVKEFIEANKGFFPLEARAGLGPGCVEEYPLEAKAVANAFADLADRAITAFVPEDEVPGFLAELEAATGPGAAFMQSFLGALEFEGVARLLHNAHCVDIPGTQWLVYAWIDLAQSSLQQSTQLELQEVSGEYAATP